MKNERLWKTAEIVLGALGMALLAVILVLKFTGKDVTALTYPMVGIVILFLICDELARSMRRRREKDEAEQAKPEEPEPTLPKDAFEFDARREEPKP